VSFQIIYFLLARKGKIAYRGYYLYLRCEGLEYHIETYLVVSCPGRTVRYGRGTYFFSVFYYGNGLENTFGTYGNGVHIAAEYVPEYHVPQCLAIKLLGDVDVFVGCRAEFERFFRHGRKFVL
jgi:hypothetical protein